MDNQSSSGQRDIVEIVADSMGDSVNPTKLTQITEDCYKLGEEPVEPPFHIYLEDDETLHYLFNGSTRLFFEDPFDDKLPSLPSEMPNFISPVVWMVMDSRLLFIYGNNDSRRFISIAYDDIDEIFYSKKGWLSKKYHVTISANERYYQYLLETPRNDRTYHSYEYSDAVAYIDTNIKKLDSTEDAGFESEEYSEAKTTLMKYLSNLSGKLDFSYIGKCSAKGAQIGAVWRNTHTTGLGFMLGAGYGIWSCLYNGEGQAQTNLDEVDSEAVASSIVRWQNAAEEFGGKRAGLAGGALGAALAIDEQTSGRKVYELIESANLDWASRQLVEGNTEDMVLSTLAVTINTYSEEISSLINDNFFDQLLE